MKTATRVIHRRRHALRSVIAGLLLLLPASFGYSAEKEPPAGLGEYVGQDLSQLDKEQAAEFWRAFRTLTGDKPEEKKTFGSFQPWSVSRFRSGKGAWIFVEVYPGYAIPDVSGVRVHVFDKQWKRIAKSEFPTGYRFFLQQATVKSDEALGQDLLVVKVTSAGPFLVRPDGTEKPAFEQGDFQRQYYALTGDRMALVRLEDNEKKLVRNSYRWSTPMKGGAIPRRSREQWIESLSSGSAAEQLATLVWLSGSHLKSSEKRYENVSQESLADSKLFEAVRDSEATSKALARLLKSKVKWVRDYARLTLEVLKPDG
jgi:hypothetical protein